MDTVLLGENITGLICRFISQSTKVYGKKN